MLERAKSVKKAIVKQLSASRPSRGKVFRVDGDRVDVQIDGSGSVLRYIEVRGDISGLGPGIEVSLIWEEKPGSAGKVPVVVVGDTPVGNSYNGGVISPDGVVLHMTKDGLTVRPGSIKVSHLAFSPALAGHEHADIFQQAGWVLTDDGAITNRGTTIHPNGQISLGSGDNIVMLDSNNPDYRLWVGDILPESSVFSVSKTGDLISKSGELGGWTIEPGRLVSDAGNISLVSGSQPRILMGAASSYMLGVGAFIGKAIDNVYKFRIGDPDYRHMSWDGSTLNVNGEIRGIVHSTLFKENTMHVEGGSFVVGHGTGIIAEGLPSGDEVAISYWPAGYNAGYWPLRYWGGSFPATTQDMDLGLGVGEIEPNDIILMKDNGAYEYIEVLSNVSGTVWSVSRNLSGAGMFAWEIGTPFVILGQTGDGRIELEANDNGPRLSIILQGASWNAFDERVRIGNLNNSFGVITEKYGFAAGDYAGGNYLLYDGDQFKIVSGNGDLQINETGITFPLASSISPEERRIITWENASANYRAFNVYGAETAVGVRGKIVVQNTTDDEARLHLFVESGDIMLGSHNASFTMLADRGVPASNPSASLLLAGNDIFGLTGYTESHLLFEPNSLSSFSWDPLDYNIGKLAYPFSSSYFKKHVLMNQSSNAGAETGANVLFTKSDGSLYLTNAAGRVAQIFQDPVIMVSSATKWGNTVYGSADGLVWFYEVPRFGDTGYSGICWGFNLPPHWKDKTLRIRVTYSASDTSSGNIQLGAALHRVKVGGSTSNPHTTESALATSGTIVARQSEFTLALTDNTYLEANGPVQLHVYRNSGHANDTYTGVVSILAVSVTLE